MKTLPELATNLMKDWYDAHSDKPYPTESERQELARLGQISENQVKAWFANKRNRTSNTRTKLKRLNANKPLDMQTQQLTALNTTEQFRSSKNIAIKPKIDTSSLLQMNQQQQFSYYHPLVLNASLVGSSLFSSNNQKCNDSCCNQSIPQSSTSNLLGQQIYFPHPYLLNTASLLQQPQINKQPILFFPSSSIDLNNNNINSNINKSMPTQLQSSSSKPINTNKTKQSANPTKIAVSSPQYDQSSNNDYTSQLLSLIHQFEHKSDQPQLPLQQQSPLNFLNNYPFVLNSLTSNYLNQQQQTKCTDSCCNPVSVSPTPSISTCRSTSPNQSHLSNSARSTPLNAGSSLENNDWNLLECSYCSDNMESNSNSVNISSKQTNSSSSNSINNNDTNQCDYYSTNKMSQLNQAWITNYGSNLQQCDTPPPIIPANTTSNSMQTDLSDQSTRFKYKCSLKNRYFQSK